jgi:hypothetical protein
MFCLAAALWTLTWRASRNRILLQNASRTPRDPIQLVGLEFAAISLIVSAIQLGQQFLKYTSTVKLSDNVLGTTGPVQWRRKPACQRIFRERGSVDHTATEGTQREQTLQQSPAPGHPA